ncbi:MAG: hypothetical protein V4706_06225 [Pseudomonadota bacterium]
MLEVLKQLQVNPQARCGQVNICNQKRARDCCFLGSFTCREFVLQADRNSHRAQRFSPGSHAPALSAKTLQGLELLGFTGKTYSLFPESPKSDPSRASAQKSAETAKTGGLWLEIQYLIHI